MASHYKGVIFDLDGTLADTLADIAGSMNRVLMARGYPVHAVESYKSMVGRGLDNLVSQALPQQARLPGTISACLTHMMADYEVHCIDKTRLYEGIPEMLKELAERNLLLSVCSNKAEPLTQKIVKHLLSNIHFLSVMGARTDFPKKPETTGVLMIAKRMQAPVESIIYVGDSDVDMMTATRAGMYAIGVSWGFRSVQELIDNGAQKVINHPLKILDLI